MEEVRRGREGDPLQDKAQVQYPCTLLVYYFTRNAQLNCQLIYLICLCNVLTFLFLEQHGFWL